MQKLFSRLSKVTQEPRGKCIDKIFCTITQVYNFIHFTINLEGRNLLCKSIDNSVAVYLYIFYPGYDLSKELGLKCL